MPDVLRWFERSILHALYNEYGNNQSCDGKPTATISVLTTNDAATIGATIAPATNSTVYRLGHWYNRA
jgi:hypothetical protein